MYDPRRQLAKLNETLQDPSSTDAALAVCSLFHPIVEENARKYPDYIALTQPKEKD